MTRIAPKTTAAKNSTPSSDSAPAISKTSPSAKKTVSAKKGSDAKPAVSSKGQSAKGQRIGYVRVSSSDQNPARQLEDPTLDRVFVEYASGKDVARPELDTMLRFIRDGDTLVVHSMDRLARNLDDLRRLVGLLTGRGVRGEFVKEALTFTGEDSPMSTLLLSVMGAFAEFERALIRERQREGIALAQKRGAYKGRKKALSPQQVADLKERIAGGEKKSVLARELGLSRETIYQYLKPMSP